MTTRTTYNPNPRTERTYRRSSDGQRWYRRDRYTNMSGETSTSYFMNQYCTENTNDGQDSGCYMNCTEDEWNNS